MRRDHEICRWGTAGALVAFFASAAFVSPNALAQITLKERSANTHSQTKPAWKREAQKKRNQITNIDYTQDVRSDGEAVTVTLNGWPIADMHGWQEAGLISYAVVDGANHLSVTVAPPHKKTHRGDEVTVLIQQWDTPVFSLTWKADAEPPQPLPLHREITFQSHTHFGPRAWQNAPQITLDAAKKQAIRTQAHRFRDILEAKNLDGMVKVFAVRNREDAISHGEDPEQNAVTVRRHFQEMLADPHWHMEEVYDDHMQFHLMADRRVVHVGYVAAGMDLDVLTTLPSPEGEVISFDMYLSFLNGQWTIVR